MFSAKEYQLMSLPLFKRIYSTPAFCELQSVSSGDFWGILPICDHSISFVKLLHKYKETDTYHEQTECGSVFDAVLEIISHDEYKTGCILRRSVATSAFDSGHTALLSGHP